jgi:peroxin-13
MVSMAEQLGNLRQTLGSVLGIFTLLRWCRTLIAKLTGRPPPADATALTPAAFSSFLSGSSTPPTTLPDGSPAPPRPSKKPLIMFAIAVFGLPYLMGKLIRAMARSQEEEEMKRQQAEAGALTFTTGPAGEQIPIDPRKLDFCRVLYDYTPTPQSGGMDLAVKKGDFVAVLSKTDPMGNASEWWRCRARDGKMGYLPSPYLEAIQRPAPKAAITDGTNLANSAPGSRTQTMKMGTEQSQRLLEQTDRTKSLSSLYGATAKVPEPAVVKGPAVTGNPGDITAESFQKSAFYS